MSRQPSKTLIGAFVLGAAVLVVIALLVFGSGKFFTEKQTFIVYFRGSVAGLNVGAPVQFRGVKIGSVTDIVLTFSEKDMSVQIPVYINVFPTKFKPVDTDSGASRDRDPEETVKMLIGRGLRARLALQSFVTGQLLIEIDYWPDSPIDLAGRDKRYVEIPTVKSPLEKLSKTVEKIPFDELFTKLSATLNGIEETVNSPELKNSIQTLNLALVDARKLIGNINSRVEPIAVGVEGTLQDTRQMVRTVTNTMEPLGKGIAGAEKGVQELVSVIRNRVKRLSDSLEKTSESANTALVQADRTLQAIEGSAGEGSPLLFELKKTLKELSAASRSIRTWADYLARHPEALIRGKGGK